MNPPRNAVDSGRLHDEMEVVRHQAGGEDRQFLVLLCLRHEREEGGVVGWLMEDLRAPVGAVEHVIAVVRDDRAGWAGHRSSVAPVPHEEPRSN